MGYNKTDSSKDSFSALMRWARRVRDKLYPNERGGLLIRKEDKGKDEEKNKTNIHNN